MAGKNTADVRTNIADGRKNTADDQTNKPAALDAGADPS